MGRYQSSGRPHLGVGVPFPLRPDADGVVTWVRYEEAIERSIRDVLLTSPGERLMLPDYGAGLRELVFAPNNSATHSLAARQVREALLRWEPRIDVEDVLVTASDAEPNLMLIDVDYTVRATNSSFNLVFPFYLTEGI
ncbi:MAG TPA: GPW/gp25 family protein [Myxococcota bacterium]|nr:GPW/gp25 family protein [Myxococcota bacterium]